MSSRDVIHQWLTVASPTRAGTPSAMSDWGLFWAFPIALGIAVIVLATAACLAYLNHKATGKGAGKWTSERASQWWFREQLRVGAKWTLKDSWASNVTVIAAAFAGVFGSSGVVKGLLGSASSDILGLTAVAAAVAVGMVGAAPLLLQIFRVNGDVTPAGLLAGAAVTMGATGGELAVICLGSRSLPLGGLQHVLPWVALVGGGLVLAVYAFTNMLQTLTAHLSKRTVKGPPPRRLEMLSDLANTRLAEFHVALADDRQPVDVVASAYGEPVQADRPAGIF